MSSYNWPPQSSGGSGGGVTSLNSLTGDLTLVAGTGITITPSGSNITIAATGSGSGSVTSVALSDGSSTPIYSISGSPVTTSGTLTFTLQSQVKNLVLAGPASGSNAQPTFRALVAADLPSGYQTIGNLTDAGTDGITITGGTGAVLGSGTSVSQHVADATHNGYLSSTDWSTFNSKGSGSVTSVSVVSANGLAGTVATATTTPAITLSTTVTGILQGNGTAISAATTGNLTDVGTDGITVTGGTGAVLGSGTSISQHVADTTHNGYLSSADWNTFNGKQASGNYITALTGDVTATGPGSVAASLVATTNGTLTTLSALTTASSLASVGTITSGTWNATTLAINHGGTGQTTASAAFNALSPVTTTGDMIYSASGATNSRLAIGSTSQVLTVSAGVPSWQPLGAGSSNNWSGTTASGSSWSTMSSSFSDGTNSGGNTLATVVSNGIAVTAGASNVAGITFTPSSSLATYTVSATFQGAGQTAGAIAVFRLTDGTNIIDSVASEPDSSVNTYPNTLTGLYAPGTTSPVTIKIQMAAIGGGVTSISDVTSGLIPIIQWSIIQNGGYASGIGSVGTFGSSPNAQGASIAGAVLTLQPADGTHPGGISTTAQTLAGAKTFSSPLTITDTSTAALTINSTSFVFDATNNALGIGTTPSTNSFIDGVNTTGAAKRLVFTGYGAGSTVGTRGRFARGTSGSPAAAQSGDTLNFLSGQGYGTSQFPSTSTGALNFVAGETFTNTSNLTYLTVQTTPTGSVTAAESMRVASIGVTLGPQSSSTAIHQVNGGVYYTTRTITGNLTLDTTTTDYIIFVTTSSGAISITLPTPVVGRVFVVKDISGQAATNNITLVRHGSEKIEGIAASKVLAANWGSWNVTTNGTDWFLV